MSIQYVQKQDDGSSETKIPIISDIIDQYDKIWKSFIRPNRRPYPLELLGPNRRRMDEHLSYERHDGSINNHKNLKLKYTLFTLTGPPNCVKRNHCMIYLHSHGGNRSEGVFLQKYAYKLGMHLCVFDFSGSGMSEGEFVTLGFEEHHDIDDIVNFLNKEHDFQRFVLWGRSMGACAS